MLRASRAKASAPTHRRWRSAPAARARQARFLLYRGFTGEQVRAALGRGAGESFEELEPDADGAAPGAAGEGDPE
jgi:SOS response regulatory protein OraA/RecX